jgi:HAD superfamily phosphoserine phosphatase-like hydrolase
MYNLVSFGLGNILIRLKGCDNGWDLIRGVYSIPNLWEKYMDGTLTRKEAKVGEYIIWKIRGITKNKLKKDLKKFKLMKGAKQTIDTLKKKSITPVIISDNPEFLVKEVAKKLGVKHIAYNRILFDNKGYAYDTKPTHTSKNRRVSKVLAIREFAKKEKISLKECVAVGNNENDLELFRKVGFKIAFNSKEKKLKKIADVSVRTNDVRKILKYLIN